MKNTLVLFSIAILSLLLTASSAQASEDVNQDTTQQVITAGPVDLLGLIEKQGKDLSREIRQTKREIAALRHELKQPGIKEIFAGIGYIFGFLGIAFYFAAKQKKP